MRETSRNRASLVLLAVFICAGFAANFLAPPLFIGFSYLSGSIFTLMTLRLFGTGWGVAAGLIASAATIFQFGHPYAMPWLCAEPLFVGWLLVKGKTRNIIFFDAVYWPVLGAPLLWVLFRYVMHVDAPLSVAAMLLYWITGITNAVVASLALSHAPILERIASGDIPRSTPVHKLVFNVLMALALIPAIVILAVYGRSAELRTLRDIRNDLEASARNAAYETRLTSRFPAPAGAERRAATIPQIPAASSAENPPQERAFTRAEANELRRRFLSAREKNCIQLTLIDSQNRPLVSTAPERAAVVRFDACPAGLTSREALENLSRCTPRAVSALPLWIRNQYSSFSLTTRAPDGAPWSIVAETLSGPYQLALVREYGAALLTVLCLNMLVLAASLYTSRRLAAPLLELSQLTTNLADRILDGVSTLLPRSMVAEIDLLSDNFTAMATALRVKFQEISLYSETLEARVRERTRELTRANEELKRENTERRLTEQQRDQLLDELLNQLRLLQKIIDAIPNPIFYLDSNGIYQGCNHAFEVSWGLSREEIIGKTGRCLFPGQLADAIHSLNGDKLSFPATQVYETQLRFADGKTHEVIIYRATYDDTKGNPAGVVGNVIDISPRKRAEAERDRLVVELQQKNKELEGIVYVASHDLRSPLVNIQGFSRKLAKNCGELGILLDGIAMDEERRARLERILQEAIPKSVGFVVDSVEKMDTILKGLLRLSRLGRAALCFENINMRELMEKIVSSMTYQIDVARARVEIGTLANCMADAGQINQVFSNLLDNAVKYRSPDRPLVVRIFSEEFEEGIRYCVEDNGIGIPRNQQETIWEIFQRLNPDLGQGEGLGLTIARRIMSRLGGSIWVESEENAGASFYVVLPKAVEAK